MSYTSWLAFIDEVTELILPAILICVQENMILRMPHRSSSRMTKVGLSDLGKVVWPDDGYARDARDM
jgi:hypothetical protein